jgi:hypothetical protein
MQTVQTVYLSCMAAGSAAFIRQLGADMSLLAAKSAPSHRLSTIVVVEC